MNTSAIKSTQRACTLAIVLWSIYALVFTLRLLRYAGIVTFNVYMGIDIAPIAWYTDAPEAQVAQWIELIAYAVTTIAVLSLTLRLILTTRHGLSSGAVFTPSNATLLLWLAGVVFFHILCTDNLAILYGSRQLYIGSSPLIVSLVTLIVALLYKMAATVSEENSLTI